MRDDIREAWLKELDTLPPKAQTTETLADLDVFNGEVVSRSECCIGVLTRVIHDQFPEVLEECGCTIYLEAANHSGFGYRIQVPIFQERHSVENPDDWEDSDVEMPEQLAHEIGFRRDRQAAYIVMNDNGESFVEIAASIRSDHEKGLI